jgi:hypothetical protein
MDNSAHVEQIGRIRPHFFRRSRHVQQADEDMMMDSADVFFL